MSAPMPGGGRYVQGKVVPVGPVAVARSAFHTQDPAVAWEFLDSAYGSSLRMQGRADGRPLRFDRYAAGPLAFDTTVLPGDLSYVCDPLDHPVVSTVVRGSLGLDATGYPTPDPHGIVLTPADRPYAGASHDVELHTVALDSTLLREVGGVTDEDGKSRRLRFTALEPVGPEKAALWRATAAYLAACLDGQSTLPPLVVAGSARLLAATALSVFPNDITAAPRPADRTDAHTDTLRRALAFIDDNAHRDIGLTDIAASVPVTPRAVQYAFRRHADTTPLAYLRRVRVHRARQDLLAADPRTTTVTEIAALWGFAHSGRFAAAYRAAYGRSPGTDLRR